MAELTYTKVGDYYIPDHCRQLKSFGKFYKFKNLDCTRKYGEDELLFSLQNSLQIIPISLS